jgi:GNAT superfamily N-acetyltransferase
MRVQRLSREDKSEVVAVLMNAFHEYPVMRYVLHTTGNEYEVHLKALIDLFCEIRFLRSWPVLGIRDGPLIAAAVINEPAHEHLPLPNEPLINLHSIIGDAAYERLALYEEKSSEHEPKIPHHFLGMIGVDLNHRGKGYAGDLLNAVKELSVADLNSGGVCLSTENPDNVPLYQHFGYHVIAGIDVGELHSWCMFLPVR